jgi:hypothetical protein
MHRAHTVSVTIDVDLRSAYAYASDPQNLPSWAQGFVKSIEQHGTHWLAETSLGQAKVRFAPANDLGVLDHEVELPSGKVHNAMRVIPNGDGCEVMFTVLQLPDVADEDLRRDLETVRADLHKLRTVLEHRSARTG